MATKNLSPIYDPCRWGIPLEAIASLPEALQAFWQRYSHHFRSRTRNVTQQGYAYWTALLRMRVGRYFAKIAEETGLPAETVQHFMSNSPWLSQPIYQQVQREIAETPSLGGGALLADDSADAKSGPHSAGAQRQYNGRLGKIDLCQVGVFLAYAQGHTWTWVDAELFVPEAWFTPEMDAQRQRVGIPPDRTFRTKVELVQQMIARARENGLPFSFVACDETYGRSDDFRSWMDREGILYLVDVPCNTRVFLTEPPAPAWTVKEVAADPQTVWQTLQVRPTERGMLVADYAARRVWTLRDGGPTPEWLVMRRETDGDLRYSLSNAAAETPLSRLAEMEAGRYFAERAIQDAKSELGWDEFRAIKYRAWEHQAALTVLASWFLAQVRLEWAERYPRDECLAHKLEVDVLPELSVANVREMLRAVLPLSQLTPERAQKLVVKHLLNRTRSRRSRLKKSQLLPRSRDPTSGAVSFYN
jgi:SRSO17 transposase